MANVPCNGCVACCRGQRIILTENEMGIYKTEETRRGGGPIELMLAHKPNGDCWYLDEFGCSIHGNAPVACREFDCRVWVRGLKNIGPLDRECAAAGLARSGQK